MMDSRFPQLEHFSHSRVDGSARRGVEEIARRTGTRPIYNRIQGSVTFCVEGYTGPLTLNRQMMANLQSHDIDDAVRIIHQAINTRPDKKVEAAERDEASVKREAANAMQTAMANEDKEAVKLLTHVRRKRKGLQSTTVALGDKSGDRK